MPSMPHFHRKKKGDAAEGGSKSSGTGKKHRGLGLLRHKHSQEETEDKAAAEETQARGIPTATVTTTGDAPKADGASGETDPLVVATPVNGGEEAHDDDDDDDDGDAAGNGEKDGIMKAKKVTKAPAAADGEKAPDEEDLLDKMWEDIVMGAHIGANALCVVCMWLVFWFSDAILKQTTVNKKKPLKPPAPKAPKAPPGKAPAAPAAPSPMSPFGALPAGIGYVKPVLVPLPNWDPMLMITAFLFLTVTSLAFEEMGYRHHVPVETSNFLVITNWFVAVGCTIVAMVAIYGSFHNDPTSDYIAMAFRYFFYFTILLYGLYVAMFVGKLFKYDWVDHPMLGKVHEYSAAFTHKWISPLIYYGTAIALVIGFTDHAEHNSDECLTDLCLPGHGVGIVVGIIAFLNLASTYGNFTVLRRTIEQQKEQGATTVTDPDALIV